jgi:hypothetical protein
MSIFGSIMSKIFGAHAASTPPAGPPAGPAAAAAEPTPPDTMPGAASAMSPSVQATAAATSEANAAPGAKAAPGAAAAVGAAPVDIEAVMGGLAAKASEPLDWRHSIVDMMKLLGLDSSIAARKELAGELHYTGDSNDSASRNVWLHAQVMQKLAENGGKVPADLRD